MTAPSPFPSALIGVMSALVEERTGIHYSDGDRELLAVKIGTRVLEAGFDQLIGMLEMELAKQRLANT